MKVAAQMCARNEADRYLIPVLDRLKDQVDLISFTDDASDDHTPDVAESFGAHVMVMPEPTFVKDESLLRRTAWSHLETLLDPDEQWFILCIDADEMLYETVYTLHEIAETTQFDTVNVEFYHMWNETHFRYDKAWRPNRSYRYFRYRQDPTWRESKLACGSEPLWVQYEVVRGNYFIDSGLKMKHLSYIKDEHKREKYERYSTLDGGQFHANAHIQSIIDTEFSLAPFTAFVKDINE